MARCEISSDVNPSSSANTEHVLNGLAAPLFDKACFGTRSSRGLGRGAPPRQRKISTPSRGLENRSRRSLRPLAPGRLDIRRRPPAVSRRILVPKRPTPIRCSGVSTPRGGAYRLETGSIAVRQNFPAFCLERHECVRRLSFAARASSPKRPDLPERIRQIRRPGPDVGASRRTSRTRPHRSSSCRS